MKWLQLYFSPMTVVGLAYHAPAKERSKSKGKSEQLRRFKFAALLASHLGHGNLHRVA